MAGRDRGRLRSIALAGLIAVAWWQTELVFPGDLGAWRPAALPGELVYDFAKIDGKLHAAAHTGLYDLAHGRPTEPFPDVPTPVVRLASDGQSVLAATDEGIYRLQAGTGAVLDGLPQQRINDIVFTEGRWLAAAEDGAYERLAAGDWERRWPKDDDAQVLTVAGWSSGLLAGTREGIIRVDTDRGVVERVWTAGIVRALFPDDRPSHAGRIWAGALGDDVLLASDDEGRTWDAIGSGIRLLSVQDVRSHPADPDRLVVGGTGVDNGELLGGVMTSDDGGMTWQSKPNRLSNTHVYRLASDQEPLVVTIGWPLVDRSISATVPIDVARFRAATNGAGVYTYAEPPMGLSMLALLQPAVRVVEPLLAGAIFLALVWRFARIGNRSVNGRRPDDPPNSTRN